MRLRKYYGKNNQVGQTVTYLRKAAGMKQKDLMAQMQIRGIDIPQASLSKLEGQERPVTDMELRALADIFGTTVDELFNRIE